MTDAEGDGTFALGADNDDDESEREDESTGIAESLSAVVKADDLLGRLMAEEADFSDTRRRGGICDLSDPMGRSGVRRVISKSSSSS